MALDWTLDDLQAIGPERILVAGSAATAGAGAFTARLGLGFTLTRTGAGTATIQFVDVAGNATAVNAVLSIVCKLQLAVVPGAAGVASKCRPAVITPASGTVTLLCEDGDGVGIEWPAANASNRINFIAFVQHINPAA